MISTKKFWYRLLYAEMEVLYLVKIKNGVISPQQALHGVYQKKISSRISPSLTI